MGQMARMLSEKPQDSLPSTSEVNPRREGKEHCKVITLRSGREVAAPGPPPVIVKELIHVPVRWSGINKIYKPKPSTIVA